MSSELIPNGARVVRMVISTHNKFQRFGHRKNGDVLKFEILWIVEVDQI